MFWLISDCMLMRLRMILCTFQVVEGINITADSFYSSQGRADPAFTDEHLGDDVASHCMRAWKCKHAHTRTHTHIHAHKHTTQTHRSTR